MKDCDQNDATYDLMGQDPSILFIIIQTSSRANGGIVSVTEILRRLQGYRRIVVTNRESETAQRWRDFGVEVQVIRPTWLPNLGTSRVARLLVRLFEVLYWNIAVARIARETQVRVAHCNDIGAMLLGVLGLRVYGVPVVWNIRDTREHGDYRLTWRLAFRFANAVVLLSHDMAVRLAHGLRLQGAETRKIATIYSPVDFEVVSDALKQDRMSLRQRLDIPQDALALGIVGALSFKKDQLTFIRDAAPEIVKELSRVRILILGDYAANSALYACAMAAVRAKNLECNITFVGYVEDIWSWYRALDLVVVASRNEGLARSMIEAISIGIPVVSYDVCSAHEILSRSGAGRVVPRGDTQGLVREITSLLKDEGARMESGRAGSECAKQLFSPDVVVTEYDAIYRQLAAHRKQTSE